MMVPNPVGIPPPFSLLKNDAFPASSTSMKKKYQIPRNVARAFLDRQLHPGDSGLGRGARSPAHLSSRSF